MKEKEIIEFIKKNIKVKNKNVAVGIGDDTAVIKYKKDEYFLITVDSIVENVHFTTEKATYYQIGKKAIAVNLSDIAAMGGIPLYTVISTGIPEGKEKIIKQLLNGFKFMAEKYRFDIVGGNLTKSNVLFNSYHRDKWNCSACFNTSFNSKRKWCKTDRYKPGRKQF